MKKISIVALFMLMLFFTACNQKSQNQSMENKANLANNPFMEASTLPFQAPDFTKIKDSDFEPALMEGIKEQLEEINKVANNEDEPTFENTLVELEKSGQLLTRVDYVFEMLSGANTDTVLQALQEKIAPKMAAQHDAIFLNPKLFERVKQIYQEKSRFESRS